MLKILGIKKSNKKIKEKKVNKLRGKGKKGNKLKKGFETI